jgi:hypothetical protein
MMSHGQMYIERMAVEDLISQRALDRMKEPYIFSKHKHLKDKTQEMLDDGRLVLDSKPFTMKDQPMMDPWPEYNPHYTGARNTLRVERWEHNGYTVTCTKVERG